MVHAVLSLTVVRMLPVFLAAFGVGLRSDAKPFLGWFGPRGLASIVFLVIVLREKLPGHDILAATTVASVVLNIIGHGVTANPLSTAFGAHATGDPSGQG
ncbi:MAG: cation:proton antiporter [Deltaproteobacteria bacterium]|nr:cation:proton antiporter [Deltaproteobacteria bacterium]